ncbi:DUF6153 family protein [Streptomyces sp. NPDC003374]
MPSSARSDSATSPARRTMWLVLAVLAGVLGMHALSPAGMPAAGRHTVTIPAESSSHPFARPSSRPFVAPGHGTEADCRHAPDPGDGGPVMDHAGGTCAAGGTPAPYAPPPLTPTPAPRAEPGTTAGGRPAAGAVDGRAPPDLAELQLLRI